MFDEILDLVRDTLDNPGKALGRLWMLWWIWSLLKKGYQRLTGTTPPAAPDVEPTPEAAPEPAREATPRPVPQRAPQPKPPAQPTPRRAWSREPSVQPPVAQKTAKAAPAFAPLIQRAETLRLQLVGDRHLRWLEPIVVSDVIAPLQAAHDHRDPTTAPRELQRGANSAVVTLKVLEHVVKERAEPRDAALLASADSVAQACHAPLLAYSNAEGIALSGRVPLAVGFDADESLHARGLSRELLLLSVPRGFGAHLNDYTTLIHTLGRRWYTALPRLSEQLQTRLALPVRMLLVDPRHGYDETRVYSGFGPWLPALVADIALSLRLGNGYVTALRKQVEASGALATRALSEGAYLAEDPPPLLRIHAALIALEALGQHGAVKHHRARLAEALPDTERSYLPLADGRHLALATEYLLALTEDITRTLLEVRAPALGGVSLVEWPGFSQTLEDAREQQGLSQDFGRSQVPRGEDAAQLLSAAWLAWDAGADPQQVLTQLHKALAPRAEIKSQVVVHTPKVAARSLKAAFHDRRTVRKAIILGAAFEPPRSSQHAERARGVRG